jgi:hypothetical protein
MTACAAKFAKRHTQESAETSEFDGFLVHRLVESRLIGDVNETSPIEKLPMEVVWTRLISRAHQLLE